jgi:CheY-like chemotaxis protein
MLTILLVDDDLDECDLFNTALKQVTDGFKLRHVTACSDLLSTIRENKPDIVFLDINMPGMSGIECLKNIRAEKKYESLPIIIYSTSNNRVNIQEAYENKANYYVIKPYSIQGIIKALEKIISIDWQLQPATSLNNFVIA